MQQIAANLFHKSAGNNQLAGFSELQLLHFTLARLVFGVVSISLYDMITEQKRWHRERMFKQSHWRRSSHKVTFIATLRVIQSNTSTKRNMKNVKLCAVENPN